MMGGASCRRAPKHIFSGPRVHVNGKKLTNAPAQIHNAPPPVRLRCTGDKSAIRFRKALRQLGRRMNT